MLKEDLKEYLEKADKNLSEATEFLGIFIIH
jgi:hypothetical protein